MLCILRIRDIRLYIHDLQEALIAGIAVLELLGKIDQLLDRIREIIDIEQEGHKIRHLHPSAGHQRGSCHEHDDRHKCRQCAKSGVVQSHIPVAFSF